ncbi:MAG: IscS subfamily cysteine desulfurase [Sphaerochaetaceae bacterium]|jgi:cysteine desulfurase|nr:IscS subfamily cysteine desulfurase [Sphaerochaetaceae bacterium]MDX9808568.1 IscS subfamily cysteine desulfurase [Sphaerochaetaceae bacterium]
MKSVYMDNNATTMIAEEVLSAMNRVSHLFGNPSSMHACGREASKAVEHARRQVAELIGAGEDEIIFTSGGTESDNTVFSLARELIDSGSPRNRIVTSVIEHPAIIETCKYLGTKGYKIDFAPVDRTGKVDLGQLQNLIDDDVLLVSIMMGNNETGTIQDIETISAMAKSKGALFHTDAVQAIGKLFIDVHALNIDYLSLSAHKFYGPKGVGALYVRKGAPFETYVKGGHQEEGRRAGTYNTQSIVGLGEAARLASESLEEERTKLWAMRERLREGILTSIPNVTVNGHPSDCLPGTLNVSFSSAEGESILLMLDLNGIAVSTGSACATGSLEPSYVLLASGLDIELAHGSIRFSLGRYNTFEDVDYVLETLPPIIKRLRGISTR